MLLARTKIRKGAFVAKRLGKMGWRSLVGVLVLLVAKRAAASDPVEEEIRFFPLDTPSPTELRKQVYVKTVLESYGASKVPPCPCDSGAAAQLFAQQEEGGPRSCAKKNFNDFRGTERVNGRDPSLPLWPAAGMPLPDGSLDRVLCRITCDKLTTGDMDLAQLVRVLYLASGGTTTPGEIVNDLQNDIVVGLQDQYVQSNLLFWLQEGERHSCYWTENHIILWLSATYLLEPWLTPDTDDDAFINVENRLQHFLQTKLTYGFYEFFSTNYHPFTAAALLNLVDFAPPGEIQSLAEQVLKRLLEEWLLMTTDEGSFYPVAGRNFDHRYLTPPFLSIIWFLTGTGQPLDGDAWRGDYVGAFLATSKMDLEPVAAKWIPVVDTKLTLGHSIEDHDKVHRQLNTVDRILFQWSAGGYLHPETVRDTSSLIEAYDLADHVLWEDYDSVIDLPSDTLAALAERLPGNTHGTDLSGAKVTIHRNRGVALYSLQDFQVGFRSGEQWPWVATVGDIAVWTQAGVTGDCFIPDLGNVANIHLPDVRQDSNVALITYRPAFDVAFPSQILSTLNALNIDLGDDFNLDYKTQVALHFPFERFDQVTYIKNWILGQKNDSYIAVWRHSLDRKKCKGKAVCQDYYFSNPQVGMREQAWAVVVGNDRTHGSFTNFSNTVEKGGVLQSTVFDPLASGLFAYQTTISVDGKRLTATLR